MIGDEKPVVLLLPQNDAYLEFEYDYTVEVV